MLAVCSYSLLYVKGLRSGALIAVPWGVCCAHLCTKVPTDAAEIQGKASFDAVVSIIFITTEQIDLGLPPFVVPPAMLVPGPLQLTSPHQWHHLPWETPASLAPAYSMGQSRMVRQRLCCRPRARQRE